MVRKETQLAAGGMRGGVMLLEINQPTARDVRLSGGVGGYWLVEPKKRRQDMRITRMLDQSSF